MVIRIRHSQLLPIALEAVEMVLKPEECAMKDGYRILNRIRAQKAPVEHGNTRLCDGYELAFTECDAVLEGVVLGHVSQRSICWIRGIPDQHQDEGGIVNPEACGWSVAGTRSGKSLRSHSTDASNA